jgi:hypothetical protein
MMRIFFCLLLLTGAFPAWAHKPSDSYLTLHVQGERIGGRWDIALRDLDVAIGLDGNDDGQLTWDEVRSRHDAIAAYALARLHLATGGAPCRLTPGRQLVERHTDGAYTVLLFTAACARPVAALQVDYRLFADVDPQHKGLLNVERDGATVTAILGADAPQATLPEGGGALAGLLSYVRNGVWHIWIGYDHILFLLSLLLPAVLVRRGRQWDAAALPRAALVDVLKVVSAFTVAHSITLSVAVFQLVQLPSRWVESAIALSVVVAALNNIVPVRGVHRWAAAFGFGLVHGFGFANVLADLGLPRAALATSLVGFNVGVELGQLAIVAVFLPLAWLARHTGFYRRWVLVGGSGAIAAVACVWVAERALDLQLVL